MVYILLFADIIMDYNFQGRSVGGETVKAS